MLLDALRPRWIEPVQEAGRWTSLTALLLLNYINAAAVLPSLVASGITIEAGYVALLTLLLCLAVFVGGGVIGHWLGTRGPGERLSFVYCVGMKNTGAALVLATTLLADQPLAMLVPLMYTLAQHFAAALLDRVVAHPARVRARVEEASNEVGPMLASRG